MARGARARRQGWSTLAVGTVLAAVGLAGCGNDWPPIPQDGGVLGAAPRIVAAQVVDSGVRVAYRVPGADGSDWPVLKISVRSPESPLPATSQDVRFVEEEGT